jgi:pyruvate/2-oxoglutarate dehydrogenase complex dihydrolipoamide acyltransferase (E2) component
MEIKLPNLGEGADSGVVVNVLVNEGDNVTAGQPIIEIETGKAIAAIPAEKNGKVQKILVKVGDKISVGNKIMVLEVPGEPQPAPAQKLRFNKPFHHRNLRYPKKKSRMLKNLKPLMNKNYHLILRQHHHQYEKSQENSALI